MAKASNRGRKANQNHTSIDLLKKLQFIAQAQKKDGGFESHCVIRRRQIMAFDGTFTIGVPIEEDFEACPHTHSLLTALGKCRENVGIVSDERGLSIVSGKLTVNIQCAPLASMPDIEPDRQIALLSNSIKDGFKIIGVLSKEGEARLPLATILLDPWIMSSTNGHALMQFRHGIDLPPALVLPKKFCDLVSKHPANLTGFGWNPDVSVTFWFEDNSFVKTQMQRGGWPNLTPIIEIPSNPWPIPEGFKDAIETVSEFSQTGRVDFKEGFITSDSSKATVAKFDCEGIPDNRSYNGKTLSAMLPHIDRADMTTYNDRIFFFGCDGNMRGVIMGIRDK